MAFLQLSVPLDGLLASFKLLESNDIFFRFPAQCVFVTFENLFCECELVFVRACVWHLPEGMFAQHGVLTHCRVFVV